MIFMTNRPEQHGYCRKVIEWYMENIAKKRCVLKYPFDFSRDEKIVITVSVNLHAVWVLPQTMTYVLASPVSSRRCAA